MKKLLKYIWAVPALLLAACSQEELVDAPQASAGEEVVISVNMPDQSNSRASFSDIATGAMVWDAEDELRIYDLDAQGHTTKTFATLTMVGEPTGTKAQFKGVLPANMQAEKLLTVYNKSVKHEQSNFGERPDLKIPMTQTGNKDASHLKKMIHMGVKCTGDQLKKGGVQLKPLCALATFKIMDYAKREIGSNLQSLTWIVNYNKPENQFKRVLNLTNLHDQIHAYMLFYADETKLVSGGNLAVKLTGENGSLGVATGEATAEKVYENGQRYAVTIGTERIDGTLYDWQNINTDVAVPAGEILAKASGEIQINTAKAAEWEVTKAADGVSYSIHKKDKSAFTEVPSNLLADASNALLQEIAFAEGITSIATNAFSTGVEGGMPVALTTIQLPESVKTIGASAFAGCTTLYMVNINKVTTFGKDAFKDHKMESVTLADNATDNGAFNGSAKFYTMGSGSVAENAYNAGVPFETIKVMPDNTVNFGNNAFALNTGTCALATFKFIGMADRSSLHPNFLGTEKSAQTSKINLVLNVYWLNTGNDLNTDYLTAGANAGLRTPTPITGEAGKVTGGKWMGYTWKSITFVNSDGSEITQQDIDRNYHVLKETGAVWGDPNAVVQ